MLETFLSGTHGIKRILVIIAVPAVAHLLVLWIRHLGKRLMTSGATRSFSKILTVIGLVVSVSVFVIYFVAIGFVLKEFGISLKAYLASASIIGLAVGFGSQGLVQDIVTGLTLVFSDLFDIGDMVEISGQTGIVQKVGMRFTVLDNYMGAQVFIPNRTVNNVVNYPRGYVRALLDITLPADAGLSDQVEKRSHLIVSSAYEQLPGIFITPPSIEGRQKTSSGKEFLRIKLRVWPGQGSPVETYLKLELVESLKRIDPAYADWMVAVAYEVEEKKLRRRATFKHV